MPFQPAVNQELLIDGLSYSIAEHPAAPDIPYGQEGRQAVVYALTSSPSPPAAGTPLPLSRYAGEGEGGRSAALKVFKPRYRVPGLVTLAERLAEFAALSGLQVCRRTILTPQRHTALLRQFPDLIYAALMPWIEGPTWMEVILEKRTLSPEQSLNLARALAGTLATLEQHSLAHCDLSGPNVLLPELAGGTGVQLVDVEQMYGPELRRPALLPGGSPGYAHRTAPEGLWSADADRFAGAVLLAEMLGWCDERVREAAWGENYFEPAEVQQECRRYDLLLWVLRERWGKEVAGLFERAWRSEALADCATCGEWLVAMPEEVPLVHGVETRPETVAVSPIEAERKALRILIQAARRLEEQGKWESALEVCRQAQPLAAGEEELAWELALMAETLESKTRTPFTPVETDNLSGSTTEGSPARLSDEELAWEHAYLLREYRTRRLGIAGLLRGSSPVEALAFSSDGGLLAACTWHGDVWLWHLSGEEVCWQNPDAVNALAFSPDDALLAGGLQNGEVRLWRVADGMLHKVLLGHTAPVMDVAFSPNGVLLASAGAEGKIILWDVADGKRRRTLKKDIGPVVSMDFSPDGMLLASALDDQTVRLWRVSDGTLLSTLHGHTQGVTDVAFSPDGALLASCSDDRTVRLWQVSDGRLLHTLNGHNQEVNSVAFSAGGAVVASGSYDQTVRLWWVSGGDLLLTLEGHAPVYCVAFSPDGMFLASGSDDGTVRLWIVPPRPRKAGRQERSIPFPRVRFS